MPIPENIEKYEPPYDPVAYRSTLETPYIQTNTPIDLMDRVFEKLKLLEQETQGQSQVQVPVPNESTEQAEEVLSKYPEGPVADIDGDDEVGEEHDIFDLFEQGVGSDEEFDDEEEFSGSGDVPSESAVFALLEAAKKGSRKAKKKAKKKVAKLIEQELEELEDLVEDAQTNVDGDPTDYEETETGDGSEFYDLLEAKRRAKKKAAKKKRKYYDLFEEDLFEGEEGDIPEDLEKSDEEEKMFEALLEAKRKAKAKKKAKKKKKIMDIFEAVEDADLLESYLLEEEGDDETEDESTGSDFTGSNEENLLEAVARLKKAVKSAKKRLKKAKAKKKVSKLIESTISDIEALVEQAEKEMNDDTSTEEVPEEGGKELAALLFENDDETDTETEEYETEVNLGNGSGDGYGNDYLDYIFEAKLRKKAAKKKARKKKILDLIEQELDELDYAFDMLLENDEGDVPEVGDEEYEVGGDNDEPTLYDLLEAKRRAKKKAAKKKRKYYDLFEEEIDGEDDNDDNVEEVDNEIENDDDKDEEEIEALIEAMRRAKKKAAKKKAKKKKFYDLFENEEEVVNEDNDEDSIVKQILNSL